MSLLTPHTTASCCDTTINLAIILSNKVSILGSTQFFVNLKIIAPWYSLSLRWDLPRHCPVTCVDIDISQDSDYPAQCLWAMSRRDNEVTATRTIHKPHSIAASHGNMEAWHLSAGCGPWLNTFIFPAHFEDRIIVEWHGCWRILDMLFKKQNATASTPPAALTRWCRRVRPSLWC